MPDVEIAYFSMEIALEPGMPTYCGGLGVLAGDTVRAAADLHVPMVAVSLLHRRGFFHQRLDAAGRQTEEPADWAVNDFVRLLPDRVTVKVDGRAVVVAAWEYRVRGVNGTEVPVYLLDCDLPENSEWDRTLTHHLYGGDSYYRLCQEVVLGVGGVAMLRALGHTNVRRFHMNEGHSALLGLALLEEESRRAGRAVFHHEDVEAVRSRCVFTTHTPVAAGHDKFPIDLAGRVLGRPEMFSQKEVFCCEGVLNMTYLALNLSRYVNGVARKHGEISQLMFARYSIDSITNGVHAATWASPAFQAVFDRHIPGWRRDNFALRYALSLPKTEVWAAHVEAKQRLIRQVNRQANAGMDVDVLTLGYGRRATAYKRPTLLFRDVERLKRIAGRAGPLQVIYAGKAHPHDESGAELIRKVFQARDALRGHVKVAYLENYDLDLAGLMTAGVDVWLNTPEPPLEASGTSGMKAALNGVPSLSVLDGWWTEGHIEDVTGWSIGEPFTDNGTAHDRSPEDAASLYDKLERTIVPMFYERRDKFLDVMLHAVAINGSFFNSQRMVHEYLLKAYSD